MAEKAYIVEAVRTAGGKRDGKLSLWHPEPSSKTLSSTFPLDFV